MEARSVGRARLLIPVVVGSSYPSSPHWKPEAVIAQRVVAQETVLISLGRRFASLTRPPQCQHHKKEEKMKPGGEGRSLSFYCLQ